MEEKSERKSLDVWKKWNIKEENKKWKEVDHVLETLAIDVGSDTSCFYLHFCEIEKKTENKRKRSS